MLRLLLALALWAGCGEPPMELAPPLDAGHGPDAGAPPQDASMACADRLMVRPAVLAHGGVAQLSLASGTWPGDATISLAGRPMTATADGRMDIDDGSPIGEQPLTVTLAGGCALEARVRIAHLVLDEIRLRPDEEELVEVSAGLDDDLTGYAVVGVDADGDEWGRVPLPPGGATRTLGAAAGEAGELEPGAVRDVPGAILLVQSGSRRVLDAVAYAAGEGTAHAAAVELFGPDAAPIVAPAPDLSISRCGGDARLSPDAWRVTPPSPGATNACDPSVRSVWPGALVHGGYAEVEVLGLDSGTLTAELGGVAVPIEARDGVVRVGPIPDAVPVGSPVLAVADASHAVAEREVTVARLLLSEIDPAPNLDEMVELSTGLDRAIDLEGYFLVGAAPTGERAMDLGGFTSPPSPLLARAGFEPAPSHAIPDGVRIPDGPAALVLVQGRDAGRAIAGGAVIDAVVYAPEESEEARALSERYLPSGVGRTIVPVPAAEASLSRCGVERRDGRAFTRTAPTPGADNACPRE